MKQPHKTNSNLLQDLMPDKPFEVMASPIATSYVVNIDEEFEHPSQFADIVHVLENASVGDHMRINLTTPGGALFSILPLLGAMQTTNCHVHVHLASDTASAGTFLPMRADTVSINDYVTVMCHNVTFGSYGTGNTVASHVAHTLNSSEKLLRDMYKHFFSEEELSKMLSGSDFYMDKDEFLIRYEDKILAEEAEMDAFMAEQDKEETPEE